MRVTLEITAGPGPRRKLWLQPGQAMKVGRTEQADFAVPEDPQISSMHFQLQWDGVRCGIRDRNSTNGTFVNGQRVKEATLHDGDEVAAGQTRFTVHIEARTTHAENPEAEPPQAARQPPPPDTVAAASAAATAESPVVPQTAAVPTGEPTAVAGPQATVLAGVPEAGRDDVGAPAAPAADESAEDEEQTFDATAELLEMVNETPFPAATMLWEDPEAGARLTVIVKATFAAKPNRSARLADQQLPVLTCDEHADPEDPTSPVRLESDMVPFKPRADVVLVGRAHAPDGRPVAELDVRLRVGQLQKRIRVFGDRKWLFGRLALGPQISQPEPFVTMELGYDRAFGGFDAAAALYCKENLAGTGLIGKKIRQSIHEKRLPNLEDPDCLITSWNSQPRPAGFGFYGRGWAPRLQHAGTYDKDYREHRAPAPPSDFSFALYNGAHPDLQVEGYLRGDEPVEMDHLSPHGCLQFRLPGIRPKITITGYNESSSTLVTPGAPEVPSGSNTSSEQQLSAKLDTLVFLPDQDTFYEVFRAVLPLQDLESIDVGRIRITM